MGRNDEMSIGVVKIDGFMAIIIFSLIIIIGLAFVAGNYYGSRIGVLEEKVGLLEDVVINKGIYRILDENKN